MRTESTSVFHKEHPPITPLSLTANRGSDLPSPARRSRCPIRRRTLLQAPRLARQPFRGGEGGKHPKPATNPSAANYILQRLLLAAVCFILSILKIGTRRVLCRLEPPRKTRRAPARQRRQSERAGDAAARRHPGTDRAGASPARLLVPERDRCSRRSGQALCSFRNGRASKQTRFSFSQGGNNWGSCVEQAGWLDLRRLRVLPSPLLAFPLQNKREAAPDSTVLLIKTLR